LQRCCKRACGASVNGLDEKIARAKDIENVETDEITETDEVFENEN
jgi:hypothetical protein